MKGLETGSERPVRKSAAGEDGDKVGGRAECVRVRVHVCACGYVWVQQEDGRMGVGNTKDHFLRIPVGTH